MKTIYVAEYRYSPTLYRVTVEERPKTFKVIKTKRLLERLGYIGRVINKKNDHWFHSVEEAIAWLIEEAEINATDARERAERHEKLAASFRDLAPSLIEEESK